MPATGHRLDGLVTAINEAVAETSEELMEKYFSGEPLTKAEIVQGIKSGVKDGTITPVVCGVATKLEAIDMVLDVINDLAPTPQDIEGTKIDIGSTEVVLPFNETPRLRHWYLKLLPTHL